VWYIQAGRGWGKTRTGAEWLVQMSAHVPRVAIVAESFGEGRDTCVEGESGIKALYPAVRFNRSLGELYFPSGARGQLFSADDPESLRGPNSWAAWCDEIAKWRYLKKTWDNLMLTMRKGATPRVVVTTTPKPLPFLKTIKAMARTHLTTGTTYENAANLSPVFFETVIKPYEGTAHGRQELNAEDVEDIAGALWQRAAIDALRVDMPPELTRIVTAIDPSATETGDEAGIITAGYGPCMCKGRLEQHGFVLSDDSAQAHPSVWAARAVSAYQAYHGDALIAEDNNGGQMVEVTIGTIPGAPRVKRIHASRGKQTRAEPIAMLYHQKMVHHVGAFARLEDELCSWVPGMASPNRLDALVWALTELALGGTPGI
jgi:phage terminase large subunit-like protein